MAKNITLDAFIALKRKHLDKFRESYTAGNKRHGDEEYPMSFPEVDWAEQFDMSE